MKIGELRKLLDTTSPDDQELEIKVWLPGSRISLSGKLMRMDQATIMVEGNIDKGSALGAEEDSMIPQDEGVFRARVEGLADKTSNAYMYELYGRFQWKKCISWLIEAGQTDKEIEAIVRSKYMRWACDNAGKATWISFRDWWQDPRNASSVTPAAIADLVKQTG